MESLKPLEKFGLSEKEAKVYLANLELGESLVSDIALKSHIPRTLVYDILERLILLGLVSYSIKSHKKHFTASSPHEFMRILKEKEASISGVLPFLEELHKIRGVKRPKVEVYEGIEGMKTVMNDILRSNTQEFFAYGSSRSSYEIMPAFMDDWHKQRMKQRIIMKVLYNNTKEARVKVKQISDTLKYASYGFMPIELESPTATLIYGNKVILQSWTKEPFAVMIEDERMAANQKEYFKALWSLAKK
ncbi:MAG: helix-turn-helix domain-containing protein [Nanoarchaeota archaeon]